MNAKDPKFIDQKSSNVIGYIIWLCALSFIAYIKWSHHELWKDEWQAWFVSRDMSLGQIFSFLYYEGHPALWYIYLKLWTPLSNVIGDVNTIQIAHLVTVSIGLYILCIKFKMHWLIKILFIGSYFILFEYGIINRGYFLVISCAFWIVDILSNHKESPPQGWKVAIAFILLCQTEVYGVFIAMSLMFYYVLTYRAYVTNWLNDRAVLGLTIGLIVFVVSVFPRSSSHISKTQGKSWELPDKVGIALQGNLSNTFLLGSTYDTAQYGADSLGLILSLLVVVGLILLFRKNKNQGLSMLIFLLMMIGFSIVVFSGGVRQWGMSLVTLIAMVELCGWTDLKDKLSMTILTVFSIFGIIHGSKAIGSDINIPFTNAKEVGEFIKAKVPENVPIVALNKFSATPVIGYAGRKFYELPEGVPFSYFKWVDKVYLPTEAELKLFTKFKGVRGIVLISPNPIDTNRFPSAQQWLRFTTDNYKNENYYLYTLSL